MSRLSDALGAQFNEPGSYPFHKSCEECRAMRNGQPHWSHHHTGEHTKGLPHEALNYYCWCLDVQPPAESR